MFACKGFGLNVPEFFYEQFSPPLRGLYLVYKRTGNIHLSDISMRVHQITTQLSIRSDVRSRDRWLSIVALMAMWLATPWTAFSQVADAGPATSSQSPAVADQNSQHYEKKIKPLLAETCFDCHSGDSVEGNFHADQLDPDLVNGKDIDLWLEVYSVVSKGEMPPDSDDLPDEQRSQIVDWLSSEIQTAEKTRKASQSHSSFRRLTRYEYNYALQDLLGLPWKFSGDLPAETTEEGGFENNSETLSMSVKQVEEYHKLAVNALQRVTVRGEQPSILYWSLPMKAAFEQKGKAKLKKLESIKKKFKDKPEELEKQIKSLEKDFLASAEKSHYLDLSTDERVSSKWHYRRTSNPSFPSDTYSPMPELGSHFAVVQPGSREGLVVELDDSLPDQGTLRIRIRASRAEGVVDRVPTMQLSFGFRSTDQGASVKRVSQQDVKIEARYGEPEIYQWDIPLDEIEFRNPYRGIAEPGGSDLPSSSEYIRLTNSTLKADRRKRRKFSGADRSRRNHRSCV